MKAFKKSVFPYDWFNDSSKLSEKQLPKESDFSSKLNNADISDKEYSHPKKVWKKLNCITFRDDQDLYLKTDVLFLADVFENFRDVCLKNYQLAHCYTSPIHLSVGDKPLKCVHSIKLLGVHMTDTLKWDDHVKYLASSCYGVLAALH